MSKEESQVDFGSPLCPKVFHICLFSFPTLFWTLSEQLETDLHLHLSPFCIAHWFQINSGCHRPAGEWKTTADVSTMQTQKKADGCSSGLFYSALTYSAVQPDCSRTRFLSSGGGSVHSVSWEAWVES